MRAMRRASLSERGEASVESAAFRMGRPVLKSWEQQLYPSARLWRTLFSWVAQRASLSE